MVRFLDLYKQYLGIREEIDAAMASVISESAFVNGKYVKCFEEEFAAYQDAQHCVGVGNGTDALEIAIEALDLPKGSEIIVPANSFIASSEAVTRSGHKVVFCDCDEKDYTISIQSLKSKITSDTKAVIVVHLYGHPCDMDSIMDIASEHALKVIEDCAQAHGAKYKGKKVGAIGHVGAFSFYPGKNLGAYGDGGAIVTNGESLAKRCRMIANHGRVEKYNHKFEGRNSRLDGLQAAVLSVKLKHLDAWTRKRVDAADYYLENLEGIDGLQLPKRQEWATQVYHLFVIRTSRRDELQKYLREHHVQTGVHYPISLPRLDAYRYCEQSDEEFVANVMGDELLSLPMGDHLESTDLETVVRLIRNFYQ